MLKSRKDRGKNHNYFNICDIQHKIISKLVNFHLAVWYSHYDTTQLDENLTLLINLGKGVQNRRFTVTGFRIIATVRSELGNSDVGKCTDFCLIMKAKLKTTPVCGKVHLKH